MTITELKSKLEKSVEYFRGELLKIRTGRASPTLLEEIRVDAYDSKMAIKELGSILVADPQNLVVSAWDPNLLDSIAKAIRESDLNLNPLVDNDVVRVPLPDLTEERRKEMTKGVTIREDEVRASLRNIRHEAMSDTDKKFEAKELSEDEKFDSKEEIDNIVKEYSEKVTELGESKRKDLLSI